LCVFCGKTSPNKPSSKPASNALTCADRCCPTLLDQIVLCIRVKDFIANIRIFANRQECIFRFGFIKKVLTLMQYFFKLVGFFVALFLAMVGDTL
jgi:hypothetical protein